MGHDLVEFGLRLVNGFRPTGADVLHNIRIGADCGKRMQVIRCEPAKYQSPRINFV
jgi:hypothetical protein